MAKEQRLVFGEVAEAYDRHRPGYPDQAFDDILGWGGLEPGSEVVEVGAGTGRATVQLARRGLAVVAIEPHPAMAALARAKQPPPREVVETTFEDWRAPRHRFAALISAQAWHWVDPQIAYPKARALLSPDGLLALMWNWPQTDGPVGEELDAVYRRLLPHLAAGAPGSTQPDWRAQIEGSGQFGQVELRRYDWSATYSTQDYLGLLRTQSDHRMLEPRVADGLFAEVAAVLAGHGDRYQVPYRTLLYLARPRP